MIYFLEEVLIAFNKGEPKGGGTKTSASPDNLFKVDKDCENLPHSKTVQFHKLVAKTLYATKQSRPDTCTSVVFLTTRSREPDLDDWDNMVHMMRYIRCTRTLPLILSDNGSGILKWWVDASFDVHPNTRGNSGGGLSLVLGFRIVSSTKQRINTRSSTLTELVGTYDFMLVICWIRYFMKSQRYRVLDNLFFRTTGALFFWRRMERL